MDPINADTYNFNKEERGIALLFHNEFFQRKSMYKDRSGDDIDYKHMKKIFKILGFKVCSFRNKTSKEILQIATEGNLLMPLIIQSETYHDKSLWYHSSGWNGYIFCSVEYIFKISFVFRVLHTITQDAQESE